jgi:hypothetical protein
VSGITVAIVMLIVLPARSARRRLAPRTGIMGKPRRLRNGSRMPTTWDFRHAENVPTPPEDCPIGTANDPWRDM